MTTQGIIALLRHEMHREVDGLRHEMQLGFAGLREDMATRAGDLIKWSFVFWVGAVGAIAMLTGVLD